MQSRENRPSCFLRFISNLLLNINLQHSPDDYFGGEWQVANRVLNYNDPVSLLALASQLALMPGKLVTRNSMAGPDHTGQ